MGSLALRVGAAYLGEDYVFSRDVVILVENGIITDIVEANRWSGRYLDKKGLVAAPALYNAHTHMFDAAFQEAGIGLSLREAVAPPSGLKHRLLRSTPPSALAEAFKDTLLRIASWGVAGVADFREGGLEGCRLGLDAAEGLPVAYVPLCRPSPGLGDLDEVAASGRGFGIPSPLAYSEEELARIREAARRVGKPIHVHVSEDRDEWLQRDYIKAVNVLGADVLVHATLLTEEQVKEIASRIKGVVVCPRSNQWWGAGLPPLSALLDSGVAVALGTDNVAWVKPDLWREMEAAFNVLRLQKPGYADPARVLRMATLDAARLVGLERRGLLKPGYAADIILLDPARLGLRWSKNPLASLVKRGGPEAVAETYIGGKLVYPRLGP